VVCARKMPVTSLDQLGAAAGARHVGRLHLAGQRQLHERRPHYRQSRRDRQGRYVTSRTWATG
jgi:hypothetical protein